MTSNGSRDTIHEVGTFDFASSNSPNYSDGKSRGIRDNDAALVGSALYSAELRILIVDDVHRLHVLESVDQCFASQSDTKNGFTITG